MIEFQRKLLGDPVRNDAFFRALKTVIHPGMTVSDIGSGTGFLSFLALKLGASRCYLYEESPDFLKLSKEIAKENDLHRRCVFVNAHSTDIAHPQKTDIVVSETLGNFAYEERIIETMCDARRFCKKGGTLIPQDIRQYVAPIVTDELWNDICAWDRIDYELRFAAAKTVSCNNMYVRTVKPSDLLKKSAQKWDRVDLQKNTSSKRMGEVIWNIDTPTIIYGFAVWWECDLLSNATLSTSPFASQTHWKQIILPVQKPLLCKKSDTVRITIHSDTRLLHPLNVRWTVTLQRGKTIKEMQKMNLTNGCIFE